MVIPLIRLFLYKLARMKTCGKLLVIANGTSIGLEEASSYYLERWERE